MPPYVFPASSKRILFFYLNPDLLNIVQRTFTDPAATSSSGQHQLIQAQAFTHAALLALAWQHLVSRKLARHAAAYETCANVSPVCTPPILSSRCPRGWGVLCMAPSCPRFPEDTSFRQDTRMVSASLSLHYHS